LHTKKLLSSALVRSKIWKIVRIKILKAPSYDKEAENSDYLVLKSTSAHLTRFVRLRCFSRGISEKTIEYA